MGQWLVLLLLSLVLGFSTAVGQLAYRVDRTALSYRYMGGVVATAISPLQDKDVHRESVASLASLVRRELNIRMPGELFPLFENAAVETFSAGWFEWTLRRHVYAFIGVLRGARSQLALPVNLSGFSTALMNQVRGVLSAESAAEVAQHVGSLPGAVDLAEAIPPEVKQSLQSFGGRYGLLSTLIMYVLPAVLTVGCFAYRRLGSSLVAAGAGYALGGGVILVTAGSIGRVLSGRLARITRDALPRGVRWLGDEVGSFGYDFAAGLWPYAVAIAAGGVLALGVGLWIVLSGRDRTFDLTQLSAADEEV